MDDFKWLNRAGDSRWTNIGKRDVVKAVATIGSEVAESRADDLRRADDALDERLAEIRRTVAEYRDTDRSDSDDREDECNEPKADVKDSRHYDNDDEGVKDGNGSDKEDGEAVFRRMSTAKAANHMLHEESFRIRNLLTNCRVRVAQKTARLTRLRDRLRKVNEMVDAAGGGSRPVPVHHSGPLPLTFLDKKIDALRLANRQATRTRDTIAGEVYALDKLQPQLMTDVRMQAAAVVQLITQGMAAKRELVDYERQHCRIVNDYERLEGRNAKQKRVLALRMTTIMANRDQMVVDGKEEYDSVVKNQSSSLSLNDSDSSLKISSYYRLPRTIADDQIPLMDWIESGDIERQMITPDDSILLNGSELSLDNNDKPSTPEDNVIHDEKINRLRMVDGEYKEAADYVLDTLGFSSIRNVLEYICIVKNVETRLKKMISVRKELMGITKETLESMTEMQMEQSYCVSESVLHMDVKTERLHRGLEVVNKQLEKVNGDLAEYNGAYNELWFQLMHITGKLDRCKVPTVRKYQQYWKKRNKNLSKSIKDAHQLLKGMHLKAAVAGVDEGDVDGSVRTPECRLSDVLEKTAAGRNTTGRDVDDGTSEGPENQAVDECRKLADLLLTKVKACIRIIGRDFDTKGDDQLRARTFFGYIQQYQIGKAIQKKKFQDDEHFQLGIEEAAAAVAENSDAAARAAGILTREQTKRQADDIVQWFVTPRETNDATRKTRKPISFR